MDEVFKALADPSRRALLDSLNELAKRFGWDDEMLARLSGEARSKVTFTIEEAAQQVVKLTVIHDGFEPGSALAEMAGYGWPNVLSRLKTMLETGEPLPEDA